MTSTLKFIDANIFIERWSNTKAKEFTDSLNWEKHATSVLVLTEVYHKLRLKNVHNVFDYIRGIMGSVKIFDFTKDDLFNAVKSASNLHINDKIHIEVMKRNSINTIISFDKDFDREKTINREEL